ncbi:MAG: hypothetical protein FJ128_07265 [Deltaproteobacteria bacterium]|nr:hypothetical protein [Deltaproteobacteria bacterium]
MRTGCLFFCLLVLAGCAEVTRPRPTPPEVEEAQLAATSRHPFKTWSLERVSRVFLRILPAVPQVDGRTYPFLGFNWWVTESRSVVIDNVWRPSPAHDAGLRQGDLILAVNNWPIHPWVKDYDEYVRLVRDVVQQFTMAPKTSGYREKDRVEQIFLLSLPGEFLVSILLDLKHVAMEARGRYVSGPVELLVAREGQKARITLFPQHLPADYAILVDSRDRQLNAFAAPGRIILTRRLVSFCLNDDELALIVGHELAHHAFGHLTRGAGYRRLGGLPAKTLQLMAVFATQSVNNLLDFRRLMVTRGTAPDVVRDAIVSAFSREDEREADTYGLWFAHQAGFDIDKGLHVFERLAAMKHDPFESTYFLDTHPPPLERLARLRRVARYIKAGRAAEVFLQSADLDRRPPPD